MLPRITLFAIIMALTVTARAQSPAFDMEVRGEARRDAYAAQVEAASDIRHVVAEKGLHFVPLDDPEFVAREVRGLLEKIENE